MASFTLASSRCMPLTREAAAEFRDLKPSPTERELDPRRLRHLEQKAEANLLVTFHWSKAKLKKDWLRMNGQHSSHMLCELPEFPDGLQVHLDEYHVDGPDGLALLFRQFDDRKSSRGPADISGAYQGLYDPIRDVVRSSAKLAIEGVAWWRRQVEGVPVPTGDDQYVLFGEIGLHTFVQWIGEVFSIKTPELRRKQIVSGMYQTWISNEAEAKRFWEQVARGGKDFEEQHPTTVLSQWYVRAREKDGRNGRRDPIKPGEFYQAAIHAWNAYRADRSITTVRADTKKGWLTPAA